MHKNRNALIIAGQKMMRIVWLCLVVACIIIYLLYRKQLTKENIAAFLSLYQDRMLIIYFFICVLRGIMLIPATPFLFAGIFLFGSTPYLLFAVFMSSVLIVSAFIYYASGYVGVEAILAPMPERKVQAIKKRLQGPHIFWFILLWAFAPFTPTDLVCCVTRALRIKFIRLIIPLLIGEGVICAFYIFNGYWLL